MPNLPMNFLAISSFVNCVTALGLAVVVLRQAPQREVARAYAIFNAAVAFYSFFYGTWQLQPTAERALWHHQMLFLGVIWINQCLMNFTFRFLNRAELPWYRTCLWGSAVINLWFSYLNLTGGLYGPLDQRGIYGFWPTATVWATLYIVFWHIVCFYSFGLLVFTAFKSSREGARAYSDQVKYMAIAFNIGYFGAATNWPMWYHLPFPPFLNSLIAVYAGIIAYAIVKHRLMNIELIIKRTVIYSVITGALTLVYLAVITGVANILQGWVAFPREFSAAIAAAIVAFLFNPVRVRVQTLLDEKFFRVVVDAREKLHAFSTLMTRHTKPEELAIALFDVLEQAYHPKMLVLYLRYRDGTGFARFTPADATALPGEMPSDNVWARNLVKRSSTDVELFRELQRLNAVAVFPLISAAGLMGYLFMGARKSELGYQENDLKLIRVAVGEAALAYEQMVYFKGVAKPAAPEPLQDVASGLIHEIKTPLANISLPAQASFADLMAVEQGKRRLEEMLPKLKERMQFIMSQAVKAGDRVEAINEFAAVEDVRMERMVLGSLLTESLANMKTVLEQNAVHIHTDFPSAPVVIQGHPKQLEIVFVNLIKNAAEAMGTAGLAADQRHLWLSLRSVAGLVEARVRDSGPGIPKENRDRLFEKHFTTKGAAGTGIGLYFSRQIVTAHGGTMTVESQEGQGTEFIVRLPALA